MSRNLEALVAAGCERELAAEHLPAMSAAMLEHGITSAGRARMFVAQALHESGRLRFMREVWGPTAAQRGYEGRRDLGNVQAGDGFRYRGRGPFQLTGRANYRRLGAELELPLEEHPELAEGPDVGWRIAGRYWRGRGLSELADAGDFRGITKRINGAATDGPPSHHARRLELLEALGGLGRPEELDVFTGRELEAVEALEELMPELERRRLRVAELATGVKRAAEEDVRGGGWGVRRRRARFDLLRARLNA